MRFDNIKIKISEFIDGKYELNTDDLNLKQPIVDMEDIGSIDFIQIKRSGYMNASWKTLILADLSNIEDKKIKACLREILRLVAFIKESLIGTENVDLYLFLAFSNEISLDECIRIESTEQLCRKYVLLPNEKINDFLSRTFLSFIVDEKKPIDGQEPIDRAFSNIKDHYDWLTDDIHKEWKSYFREYSGSELAEKLVNEVVYK